MTKCQNIHWYCYRPCSIVLCWYKSLLKIFRFQTDPSVRPYSICHSVRPCGGGILYMIYTWDEGVQHWRTMTFNTGTQFRNENIFSIFQTVASVYKQKFHWYRHFESNLDCVEYYFQWKAPFWQKKGYMMRLDGASSHTRTLLQWKISWQTRLLINLQFKYLFRVNKVKTHRSLYQRNSVKTSKKPLFSWTFEISSFLARDICCERACDIENQRKNSI